MGGADPGGAARLDRMAATASVAVAVTLVVGKLVTFLITGSIAILTSLIDSGMDVLASAVTFLSVRHAARPPDRGHRYGHGKAEGVGALAQAGFVTGSAVVLAYESLGRLLAPRAPEHGWLGVGVMAAALALTSGLVLLQGRVIARTGSLAIRADRLHYQSDLLMNLAVMAALALVEISGWPWLDPLFGLAVVPALLVGAVRVARRALDTLMDRELPPDERARITALALEHPGARDVHDLRSRRSGRRRFIELHLELDGALTLAEAHRISHEVEARICEAFPDADVLIHQEPAGIDDERLDDRLDGAS